MTEAAENKEIIVRGGFVRTAGLRHEWCDYLVNPPAVIESLRRPPHVADILTFLPEIYDTRPAQPFHRTTACAAVLTVSTFDDWWAKLNFKVRNKIRKAEKNGVELRDVNLTDDFANGVEGIYNESAVRQGKRFWHYGKDASAIKEDLSDFIDRSSLVGAYYQGELIGFMKIFHGLDVLRTIHIIAKLSHRDKPVMDAFIARAVKMCHERQINHFQYGSWSARSLGEFKIKHGFQRVELPRYFAPLTLRGKIMLKLNLHQNARDYVPQYWVDAAARWRGRWNELRFRKADRVPASS